MKKRSQDKVVYDILINILNKNGKIKPTQLMTKANLSYKMMNQYLEDLIDNDYINRIKKNNRQYLLITNKGRDFLDKIIKSKTFSETIGF